MVDRHTQLDLFGQVEGAERAAAEASARKVAERAEWLARFERVAWVAPYDTTGGLKKGESSLGFRCPDPLCGKVEINASVLSINHGFDPTQPGHAPWDGRCMAVWLAEHRPHRVEEPHRLPEGGYCGDCSCGLADGLTAATEAELGERVERHAEEIRAAVDAPTDWSRR